MDTVRFWIGLIVVMCYPVGLLLWVVIHPFAAFWRRLGATWTYEMLAKSGPQSGTKKERHIVINNLKRTY